MLSFLLGFYHVPHLHFCYLVNFISLIMVCYLISIELIRILWTKFVTNGKVFIKIVQNEHILRIRHRPKFLGHIKRRMGLENLKLKGLIECKTHLERQLPTYLTSLCEWIVRKEMGSLVKGQT